MDNLHSQDGSRRAAKSVPSFEDCLFSWKLEPGIPKKEGCMKCRVDRTFSLLCREQGLDLLFMREDDRGHLLLFCVNTKENTLVCIEDIDLYHMFLT